MTSEHRQRKFFLSTDKRLTMTTRISFEVSSRILPRIAIRINSNNDFFEIFTRILLQISFEILSKNSIELSWQYTSDFFAGEFCGYVFSYLYLRDRGIRGCFKTFLWNLSNMFTIILPGVQETNYFTLLCSLT